MVPRVLRDRFDLYDEHREAIKNNMYIKKQKMNSQERHRVNRHLERAHELLGFGTSLHTLPSNQIKQIIDELNCNDSSKFCRLQQVQSEHLG